MDTNLVQIPVLVLSPSRERLRAPIAPEKFSIRFNGGPPSRPKYVRVEGEEPIHLAFVVDARSPQDGLLPKIVETISSLAPAYLHASDRVSIYVISCGSMQAVEEVPAEPMRLRIAVDSAFSSLTERRLQRKKSRCASGARLWDDLFHVTARLQQQSGWRALIAITAGDDSNSKTTSAQLALAAQKSQVAFFGINPIIQPMRGIATRGPFAPSPFAPDAAHPDLQGICEVSGGLMTTLYESNLTRRVQQFVQMLRDRYILEFPRPAGLKLGNNLLIVTIDGSNDFIRAAGDQIPVKDSSFQAASTTAAPANVAPAPPPEQPPPAPSFQDSPDSDLLAAMRHGEAASTQLLFEVRVVPAAMPPKPGDPPVIGALNPALKIKRLVRYDVTLSLAAGQLTFAPASGGVRKATVEFVMAAYDGEGRMLNIVRQTAKWTLTPERMAQFLARPVRLPLQFDLPPGNIFLRLGAQDAASARIGTLEIPQTVPK